MANLLDPAILFFVLGVLIGAVRSNLEIPPAVSKFLSLYLLMAIGLKGGFALSQSEMSSNMVITLLLAVGMAFLIPALGYQVLKNKVDRINAAAVVAAYGSVSAVTFVASMQYVENLGLAVGGHMTVALVLMESPAIIMAVLLANSLRYNQGGNTSSPVSVRKILHESFTDGAHLLLIGAMVVGYLSGASGQTMMKPFIGDLFKGMLAFFLLDMGLMVAKQFSEAIKASRVLLLYAILAPVFHATVVLCLGAGFALPMADVIVLMVLCASASYIVVPAVLRYAIPEANPALYFGLSLGVTFPFNILIGIPLYYWLATYVYSLI